MFVKKVAKIDVLNVFFLIYCQNTAKMKHLFWSFVHSDLPAMRKVIIARVYICGDRY